MSPVSLTVHSMPIITMNNYFFGQPMTVCKLMHHTQQQNHACLLTKVNVTVPFLIRCGLRGFLKPS